MSEEGAPTVRLTHAETHADPSACSSSSMHTGGPVMQQQTPADTEEKRVSSLSAGFIPLPPTHSPRPAAPVIWPQLESAKLNLALQRKAVSIWHWAHRLCFFLNYVFLFPLLLERPHWESTVQCVRCFFGSEPCLKVVGFFCFLC